MQTDSVGQSLDLNAVRSPPRVCKERCRITEPFLFALVLDLEWQGSDCPAADWREIHSKSASSDERRCVKDGLERVAS